MNADRIYADPSTITGSIGIFGLIPTIPRALDKIGVHTDGVGTTRFAGAFDITRPLRAGGRPGDPVGDRQGLPRFHRQGRHRAQASRSEQVDAIARGRVWSGAQAKERGLVDELGGLQQARRRSPPSAPSSASRTSTSVRYIEKAATPFERFFTGFVGSRIGARVAARFGLRARPAGQGVAAGRAPTCASSKARSRRPAACR